VTEPSAVLGRSWLYVHSPRADFSCALLVQFKVANASQA
jgi:hypothetical protein